MKGSIPSNAKCVFKGILFDVYQWEQEMFDGSFATFEKVVRFSTSQIIVVTSEKKIILFEEEQPYFGKFIGFPGGMIERTETPEENAKKELLEETGMKAETIFLWKQAGMNGKVIWKNFYFIAKGCIKIQEPQLEPGEKITPIELDFEDYIKYTQREDFRNPEFQNIIFRMIHTPGELEKFKKLLFD